MEVVSVVSASESSRRSSSAHQRALEHLVVLTPGWKGAMREDRVDDGLEARADG